MMKLNNRFANLVFYSLLTVVNILGVISGATTHDTSKIVGYSIVGVIALLMFVSWLLAGKKEEEEQDTP